MDFYSLTSKEFEEMCYEYAKYIYDPKKYKLFHTRYSHDGGKDLEINFYDKLHRYKIWAECKIHKRNIGLEEIGKNVVLVIANNINKVIFFSASKIRENAKTEILYIGKRLNFDVCFLDDDNLKAELKKYPKLVKKYFTNYDEKCTTENKVPQIKLYLNEDNSFNSENNNVFYLREGKIFYVNILIKNTTKHYYTDISVDWLYETDDVEMVDSNYSHDLPKELVPYTDYLITYLCNIKTLKYEEIELPNIIFNYTIDNEPQTIEINLPKLNLTKYIMHPLNGKKYLEFLYNDVEKTIIKSKTGLFQLIDIEGKSGCGKSRMIREMKVPILKNDFLYLTYDSYDYSELDIFRKIICDLIDIPYQHKNIFYDQKSLKKILISTKLTQDAAEIISNFIFNRKVLINQINYISQYICTLIENVMQNKYIFIAIDNIQNNNDIFFDILKELILYFEITNSSIILITVLNTERLIQENISIVTKYKEFIENKKTLKPNQFKSFYPKGFEDDITIFWMESLNRHNPQDYLVNKLIKKFGDNPLEVTTVSDYLKQNLVLKQIGNEEWYVANHIEFQKIMDSSFHGFQLIFKKRILAIYNSYSSYLSKFKEIISTLLLFNNYISVYDLSRIIDSYEAIDILRDHLIIKKTNNTYSFYHDSIYQYFKNESEYIYIMIDKIYNFLLNNKEIKNINLVYFNIFYYKNDYKKYPELAYSILQEHVDNLRYIQAIELGKELYNNDDFKSHDILKYLQCAHLYAFACSSLGSKDTSCIIFIDLCHLFIKNHNLIDIEETCNFFRDAINAQLQSNRFEDALKIIDIYKKLPSIPKVHEFLLYNREAVTYLSLNKMKEADNIFQKSLSVAKELESNSYFWTSTTYSDIALMYFYKKGSETNRQYTIKYLNYAIRDYEKCEDDTIYRKFEILWHKAFIYILEKKYDDALNILSKNEDTNSIYEKFRLKNLIALCKLYNHDFNDAIDVLKSIKAECEINQHSAATVKINNNLGVVYIQLKEYKKAYEYLNQAYSEIINEEVYLKMYPVISNYLLIMRLLDKPMNEIQNRIAKIPDTQFKNYCKRLITSRMFANLSWTLWNFNGADYIF